MPGTVARFGGCRLMSKPMAATKHVMEILRAAGEPLTSRQIAARGEFENVTRVSCAVSGPVTESTRRRCKPRPSGPSGRGSPWRTCTGRFPCLTPSVSASGRPIPKPSKPSGGYSTRYGSAEPSCLRQARIENSVTSGPGSRPNCAPGSQDESLAAVESDGRGARPSPSKRQVISSD
jgi:hypothetical protein